MPASKELVLRMKAVSLARRKAAVAFNPCGLHCPEGKPFYCCNASICNSLKKNFDIERKRLVKDGFITSEQNESIDSYWNEETGFWTPDGCGLPRELRYMDCLVYVCGDH